VKVPETFDFAMKESRTVDMWNHIFQRLRDTETTDLENLDPHEFLDDVAETVTLNRVKTPTLQEAQTSWR
jgi:hypothetical protein